MELLALLSLTFCFLTLSGLMFGAESGPPVTTVTVKEGDDVILPCSPNTNENIESMLFDWKKEGTVPQKEVFMYDEGKHYNNGLPGQNEQFKGRVSHFPDELKHGNASIRIKQTRLEDKGNYTCDFPRLKSENKIFRIELVVGAAPEPYVINLEETDDWALLQCDVKGAYPEPTVEWWDSNNQIIPSEEPQVSKRGEHFYITLKTTVTKTDRYRCVATQKDIHHQIYTETNVRLNGAAPEPSVTNLKETDDWALLQCDVKGAYPEPTVEWWDSNNQIIPSEEPQVSKRGEHFYITLKTTVTKTDYYRCVATQKDIHHQIYTGINVRLNGFPLWAGILIGVVGILVGILVGVCVGVRVGLKFRRKADSQRQENGRSSELQSVLDSKQPYKV